MNFVTKCEYFAILSDTHNNILNTVQALDICRKKTIDTIIHCGDFTSPDTVHLFDGFQVIHVSGNGDFETQRIQVALAKLKTEYFSGVSFEGKINDILVSATHGHIPGKLEQLIYTGRAQYIFHGHTHQKRDFFINNRRIINPGALGGDNRGDTRSFCLFNIKSSRLEFIEFNTLF